MTLRGSRHTFAGPQVYRATASATFGRIFNIEHRVLAWLEEGARDTVDLALSELKARKEAK